jgi:hypothetical protein
VQFALNNRRQRLIPRSRGNFPLDGECGKNALDLGRTHSPRTSLAIGQNEQSYPADVCLLSTQAVSACCNVGKNLDSPNRKAESAVQQPESMG